MAKSGVKLRVEKSTAIIEEGEDTFFGKLIAGTRGKLTIKTPFGVRVIKKVKKIKEVEKLEKMEKAKTKRTGLFKRR